MNSQSNLIALGAENLEPRVEERILEALSASLENKFSVYDILQVLEKYKVFFFIKQMDSYNQRENLSKQLKESLHKNTKNLKLIGYSPLLQKLSELGVVDYSSLVARLDANELSVLEEVMSIHKCKKAQEEA